MGSYTAMSDEAIRAMISAMKKNPHVHYSIRLNHGDFSNLMWALQYTWGGVSADVSAEIRDWAFGFASEIAETLGIEFV